MHYATRGGYAANAARYQELEVMSASPAQLVVIVYDHLLACLKRAKMAAVENDLETRTTAIARAREAVIELRLTLDEAQGGAIAGNLAALYDFFVHELFEFGTRPDLPRLERLIGMVTDLRGAFAQVAEQPAAVA